MVLARDLYQCKIQGEGCTRVATQAHHLHGKRYGDDPRYLVAACRTCNLAAGDPTSGGDPPPQPRTQW
jgi:5-methylcytosine-specific restriction endonuclease McrA